MYYDNNPYDYRYNSNDSSKKNFYQSWHRYHKQKDHGPNPFVTNIHEASLHNNTFRTALWTGEFLQLTLMSIDVCGDIGLEMHPDVDQFIRIEQGHGVAMMGDDKNNLYYQKKVREGYVIFIPAGIWHNLINIGYTPIKLYSIYSPPNHPHGTINLTKDEH